MRKQQVNLYQPVFRKQAVAFSFHTLLLTVLASVLVMGGLYGLGEWQTARLENRLKASQARHDRLEADVMRMAEQLPKPRVNKMLESELQQLTARRKSGFALLNTLKSRIAAKREGFSPVFEGLARQSFPELWFTHVRIAESGNSLSLKGKSLKPEWVPLLLRNLQQEPAFSGRNFQIVELIRQDALAATLDFSLMTAGGSEKP